MSDYAYMLRFTLHPGHFEEERLEELVRFCRQSRVDDVMFFIAPLNLNHISEREADEWLSAIRRAKHALAANGVTTSINPLNTLTHDSAGGVLPEGLDFRMMVDPYGNESAVTPCPLCSKWRAYIVDMYSRYAALQPYSLWIEDDFRFHNHGPLAWGGCFCEEHIRLFAREAGSDSIGREEFVRGLLAAGEPHEYRRIWLDSCRQTMVELANAIGRAVHRVSPETRIGLMTSHPAAHAAEGRDWHGILGAVDGDRRAIVRPHLPAYMETSGMSYAWEFNAVSRLTAALLPETTARYPELENVPYTRFAKSEKFQRYQLETSLLLGSKGITLNVVDMVGNGVYPEEGAERWLNEAKDFLNSVASLQLRSGRMQGVRVLVDERSSYSLHSDGQLVMEALYPSETFWAGLLSAYGIANAVSVDSPAEPGIVAVSGQLLRGRGEAAIRELFAKHAVLLDGGAVDTLVGLGLGELCGIREAIWREAQTIERIYNGRTYAGIKEGRMRPYLAVARYLDIRYDPGAVECFSRIVRPDGTDLCPGMAIAGGKVFIMPYGQEGHHGLFNPIRRAVVHEAVENIAGAGGEPLRIASYAPHAAVYEYETDDGAVIAVANHSLDDIEGITLAGPVLANGDWVLYSRNEPLGNKQAFLEIDGTIALNARVPGLSMIVLHRRARDSARK